ncbi:MAG: C10 family peptidase [Bacteroidales bacterium]
MNRFKFIMVLCFSQCWLVYSFGQRDPGATAEKFFAQKLVDNHLPIAFHFDDPIRYGNLWIFECSDPKGFVLVRKSDSCRVVGYSVSNLFTRYKIIPSPALAILQSISAGNDQENEIERRKTACKPIGPLLRTTWSQEGYFNYYCPENAEGPDNHVYAGCVPVAMGQILRYFGKFNDFQLTVSYEDFPYGTLTANLGNYDWERMENRPITLDTEVSKLMYGLGVLTKMGYGPSGSSTSNFNVYDGFKKLKYFTAIRMIRSVTTPEVWSRNFHQNISDFQPIYVSGSGHSFVCDGIDAEGLFHFNLGWYGYADGYYPLNQIFSIDPSEAIFDLRPYSNNLPPANLILDTLNSQKILKWEKHRLAETDPIQYRIYLNDTTSFVTQETTFNTSYFPAGNHEIMVTAIYPQGESCWIGPIQFAVEGNTLEIPDLSLKRAIEEELIVEDIDLGTNFPNINQLLKIKKLEISQPLSSLAGLENCHNLQVVKILPGEQVDIDLGPVSLLKRLKQLTLENVSASTIPLIARNDRLTYLELNHCPLDNLDFLAEISTLLSLKLSDIAITNTDIFSKLQSLKKITLTGCGLTFAGFIQDLTNLETIDLSRNQLPRVRLNAKLTELQDLNLSRNQINELFFLEYIPNIKKLYLNDNQITRFSTGLNLKYIKELNLQNNLIDSVWFGVSLPTLTRLSLGGNKIRTIRQLNDFVPELTYLDIGHNQIRDFWNCSLQYLEYLDFSENKLDLINALVANPGLKHVDLSNNLLADIYPVTDHTSSSNIQFLDLTGNPLSVESVQDLSPSIREIIDTLLLPAYPQTMSPGHPVPTRNQAVKSPNTELSWETVQLPATGYYEIFTGPSAGSLKLAGQSLVPLYQVDLSPGQNLYWRIRSVLPDTSYLSGVFKLVTYEPFSLPFKETFENYAAFGQFSELSDCWIRASKETSSTTDGIIDPYRRSEGKQSLKLYNISDLHLPMSHLYQSSLYISMQLLVSTGNIGSVRLNDINGANLELFFKSNGRFDLFLNNKFLSELPFSVAEWFTLQFNLYSKGNEIWIKVGNTDIPVPFVFTGHTVHVGEMQLASAPGRNWPFDGQPLFHIDNLEIKAYGAMTSETTGFSPEILLYPNPASQYIVLETSSQVDHPKISLFDFSGRRVEAELSAEGSGRWRIDLMNLVPGIYLIRIDSGSSSYFDKFLISR